MWIFSLFLLSIAVIVPFAVTAVAGLSGRDRRVGLKVMFRLGCVVYVVLVALTVYGSRGAGHGIAAALAFSMFLWGIPLASSGLAVLVFWGKPPQEDLPEIGF